MNLSHVLNEVIAIAKDTGSFLKSEIKNISKSDIESKSEHDYVTYVDKKSEELIINALRKILPDASVIAEESHSAQFNSGLSWIIDPLDGTTNYIHKIPLYAVSIALVENNQELLGVIYEPNLDECYSAFLGENARLNNEIIQVSQTAKLSESFLATGFPSRDYSKMKEYMELFEQLMFNTQGLRRLGTAAMDMAYVACGRFDGFYEYYLSPWDVAAGSIIVKEAGGSVADFSGGCSYLFNKELMCCNSLIYQEFIEIIRQKFSKV